MSSVALRLHRLPPVEDAVPAVAEALVAVEAPVTELLRAVQPRLRVRLQPLRLAAVVPRVPRRPSTI